MRERAATRRDSGSRRRLGFLFASLLPAAVLASVTTAAAETHEVQLAGMAFVPSDLTIQVGDTVRFRNSDSGLAHNVRADNGAFRCATGCDTAGGGIDPGYEPGQEPEDPGDPHIGPWTFTRTFQQPGEIRYHCEVHGAPGGIGMSGRIVVVEAGGGGGGGGSAGQARFTASRFTATEDGGTATVTVERVGGELGAVSLTVATGGGSATAGADFQAVSQTVSWAAGAGGSRSVQIALLDDGVREGTETVSLVLSGPTGGLALGAPQTSELRILDDEEPATGGGGGSAGSLRFESSRLWAFEDGGELVIRVLREGGASGAVSVPVTVGGGSAAAGADFGGGAGTLQWGNGDDAPKTLVLAPVDDGPGEGTQKVVLQLGQPTGGAAVASGSAVTVFLLERPASCATTDHQLCLGDRFVAEIAFATQDGQSGRGDAVSLTSDSGYFTFFDPTNVEVVVKALATCPINGHFWVFAAGLTNVEVDLTVIDTQADEAVVYSNPLGTAFLPIQDIEAFATCP